MLKILQARLQLPDELPDVQAGFRKSRQTRDQIANICWIIEKAGEFQKNIYSASLTLLKPLTLFSSVTQSCPTLCDPMNRSTPGLPVHHQLPEFTQTHVHRVGDTIQPSHSLSYPSPPTVNPSQHQGLFQFVYILLPICLSAFSCYFQYDVEKWRCERTSLSHTWS